MKIRRLFRERHYGENHDALDRAIQDAVKGFLEAGLSKDKPMRAFQLVLAYALLYNRDLSCIVEDLADPPSEAHTNLYSRLVILVADECFEKLPQLLGKAFRQELHDWRLPPTTWKKLNGCGRDLNTLRKAEGRWVGKVRDTVIAHRDLRVAMQWRMMRELDHDRAAALANSLLAWTNGLYSSLTEVAEFRTRTLVAGSTGV